MEQKLEELDLWQNITRLDFEECMKWVNNLRSFMRCRTQTKAQQKAALRRIAELRASINGLEVAITHAGKS